MPVIAWKSIVLTALFPLSAIVIVSVICIVWQHHGADTALSSTFRPGTYAMETTFSDTHQVELSRFVIHATTASNRTGTITIASFGNSFQDRGTWWVNNGWLDASLTGHMVGKPQETRHIHLMLTFPPDGVITGYGRDLITASLGETNDSPLVETMKIEAYQTSGHFLHA